MRKIIATSTLTLLLSTLGASVAPAPAQASSSIAPTVSPSVMPSLLTAVAAGQLDGKINVNTATEKQWELLPGIGPATAKKLVAYRSKRPFGEVTHVMRIKGIGRKTFNQIKPFLSLKGETTLRRTK
jgi:competence ComEA-like helix-hairpin-helix protein